MLVRNASWFTCNLKLLNIFVSH